MIFQSVQKISRKIISISLYVGYLIVRITERIYQTGGKDHICCCQGVKKTETTGN